jgi:hypothetical protein
LPPRDEASPNRNNNNHNNNNNNNNNNANNNNNNNNVTSSVMNENKSNDRDRLARKRPSRERSARALQDDDAQAIRLRKNGSFARLHAEGCSLGRVGPIEAYLKNPANSACKPDAHLVHFMLVRLAGLQIINAHTYTRMHAHTYMSSSPHLTSPLIIIVIIISGAIRQQRAHGRCRAFSRRFDDARRVAHAHGHVQYVVQRHVTSRHFVLFSFLFCCS